jgi:hypothetical protein
LARGKSPGSEKGYNLPIEVVAMELPGVRIGNRCPGFLRALINQVLRLGSEVPEKRIYFLFVAAVVETIENASRGAWPSVFCSSHSVAAAGSFVCHCCTTAARPGGGLRWSNLAVGNQTGSCVRIQRRFSVSPANFLLRFTTVYPEAAFWRKFPERSEAPLRTAFFMMDGVLNDSWSL